MQHKASFIALIGGVGRDTILLMTNECSVRVVGWITVCPRISLYQF